MTENEAIKNVTAYVYMECENIPMQVVKALDFMKNCTQEIQQYRAIGTVKDFKAFKTELSERYCSEHDKEIRNMAIDEFAERLHELCGMEIGDYQYPDLLHESRIDEIAEQLKGEKQ